jgi:hypothetical protein
MVAVCARAGAAVGSVHAAKTGFVKAPGGSGGRGRGDCGHARNEQRRRQISVFMGVVVVDQKVAVVVLLLLLG